jgi:glycine/D-amino acid oxidase-like deaminating enzyme
MAGLGILWQETAPSRVEAPVYPGGKTVDLAIIGGGFTGCSAALRASEQGLNVALLEAETIGYGGSGRNVGLVNAGLWLPPDTVCSTLGKGPGERLNQMLAGAPDLVFKLIEQHAIDCEARRAGTLHLAHSTKGLAGLQGRLAQMQTRGAPVTLLSADETRARTGTAVFYGALHDARAGTIQPLSYARGLARAAEKFGAKLYEHSPAISVEHRGGDWIINTQNGPLTAKMLLLATNAYHHHPADLPMPAVTAVNYFQLATEPLKADQVANILPGGEGCWDSAMIMTSLRLDAAGRVILGGIGDADSLNIQTNWAERKLARFFPNLRGTKIIHSWSGRISMTADHLPRILRLGPQGYSIFGYSGRGIGPGTVFGRAMAEALSAADETNLPVAPVNAYHEPFCRLKTVFYETGARLVHLTSVRRS